MNGLKKKWELNGRLIKDGDLLYIEYNPAEHCYCKGIFMYEDGKLIDEDRKISWLNIDSVYIDKIEFR